MATPLTPMEKLAARVAEKRNERRSVQQPPLRREPPLSAGLSPMDRLQAKVQRRGSMTSGLRYQQADRAAQSAGYLEAAGVQGLSAFLKILDIINTPQQMVFGAAIGLLAGQNIIDAAWEGARDNAMGSDLLKAAGVGKLGTVNLPIIGEVSGRGVLGLPLDLLIDIPIFGAIGKAAKVARLPVLSGIVKSGIIRGGRSLRKEGLVIPKLAPARVAKGKSPGVAQEFLDSILGQYRPFQSKNEVILFDLIQEGKRIGKGKQGKAKKVSFELGERAEAIAKKEGITVSQLGRQLLDILERKTGTQGLIRNADNIKDFKLRPDGRVFGESFDKEGRKIASKIDPKVDEVTQAMVDIKRGADVKTLKGKQELFPVANDVAQIRTAKQSLKAERDAFLAKSRKARNEAEFPFKLKPEPPKGSGKDIGFDNLIISQHGDEVYDLAMSAKQLFHDGVLQEINHGVATVTLDDTWLDYMTHYLLPAAKGKLLAARTAGALEFTNASRLRVFNPNHSFQLLRKWDGMTVNELNALGKKGLLPGFEGVVIEQLFSTDIATIMAARLTRGVKAVTDADIFTNAARQLGRHIDDVPAGARDNFRKLAITANQDERLKPLGAYMNNYVFEKDVARHLDSYFNTMIDPRGMHPFLAKIDKLQGVWKASTLFMFPAYHSRNFIGNLWNNHLKDATMWFPNRFGNAGYYSAAAAYSPIRKGVVPLQDITLGGVKYTRSQMDDLLEKHGISNQFREFLAIPEVAIGVKPLPGGEFLGRVPGVGRATERGIIIGSWIEDHARKAHFFSVLDKSKAKTAGLRAREAAASTKLHLFNYDELNDFEQTWLRRAMPFFAWTRNNLPLQVRNIVSQPQKFSQLKDFIDFVEGEKTPPRGEDALIQKWMKRNSPVRTRVDGDGNAEYFLLGGWLPAADIGKIAEPWKILLDELSPFLKEPVEQLINFDTFLQREIREFPGQKQKFLGVNISTRFVGVLRNIRLLSLIDSIGASVEGAIRGEGKTGIFSDATAKPIQEMILAQTVGFQIREVERKAAARGVLAQMTELKSLLRRELRAERVNNAERVKDELLDLTRRLRK